MSACRRFPSIYLIGLFLVVLVTRAVAQNDTPAGDAAASANAVENSKFQAAGVVNANAVFVRSGPSENDYPVMKLDKGASITAVGVKFEWLKIAPPEGSFCYVAKAYVDRHGDGTQGKVTNTLYVRVGSNLNAMKTKIAMKLEPGSDVTITGEQDEYYKIKPPEGAFLYVNKQFVEPVKMVAQNDATAPNDGTTTTPPPPTPGSTDSQPPQTNSNQPGSTDVVPPPTTNPTNASNDTPPPTTGPATTPSMASAEEEFDKLETAYAEMIKKPLDQQELGTMQASYEKLAATGSTLPESLRRIAEGKATFLKSREKDRQEYLAFKKKQEEATARQMALQAEREEINQRLRATDIKYYTAVGVLRPSSLQQGKVTLYRLTDPANGRTVVYIRTDDSKIVGMIGEFVGVKGEVAEDAQLGLRVITPSAFEPCDPSKLYTNIASQIIPPSLMPGGTGTATTGNE